MFASVGSLVVTLPAVLADLSGSLGKKELRNIPNSAQMTSIWEGLRGLLDDGRDTEEKMDEAVTRG